MVYSEIKIYIYIYIKPNNLKVLGSKNNPKDINTISKISQGHLSFREENFR
jgi:hypothetical protein